MRKLVDHIRPGRPHRLFTYVKKPTCVYYKVSQEICVRWLICAISELVSSKQTIFTLTWATTLWDNFIIFVQLIMLVQWLIIPKFFFFKIRDCIINISLLHLFLFHYSTVIAFVFPVSMLLFAILFSEKDKNINLMGIKARVTLCLSKHRVLKMTAGMHG